MKKQKDLKKSLNKKNSANRRRILILAGVLCLASAGGVSAYLTDYEKVSNQFTVGKVEVDLTEDNWKPEENTKIEPGKDVAKDPVITNTGINDAFVYLEVSIPMADVITATDDGSRLEKKMQELFTFEAKESWIQLKSETIETNQVYVFAYHRILKPQESTESLFDTVKFINIVEGQLDGEELAIPVHAYAIQSSYTGGEASDFEEQARAAYDKYVNQNKEQPGKVTE